MYFGLREIEVRQADIKTANGGCGVGQATWSEPFCEKGDNVGRPARMQDGEPYNSRDATLNQVVPTAHIPHRPGYPAGTIFAIIAGILVLIILALPLFYFGGNYYDGVYVNLASGYDLAFGSVPINGVRMSTYLNGYGIMASLLLWLIVACGVSAIAFGLLSIPSSDAENKRTVRTWAGEHCGTIVAISGFLVFVFALSLHFTFIGYTHGGTFTGSNFWVAYWGGIIFWTQLTMMITGGVVAFSGLEINRGIP